MMMNISIQIKIKVVCHVSRAGLYCIQGTIRTLSQNNQFQSFFFFFFFRESISKIVNLIYREKSIHFVVELVLNITLLLNDRSQLRSTVIIVRRDFAFRSIFLIFFVRFFFFLFDSFRAPSCYAAASKDKYMKYLS